MIVPAAGVIFSGQSSAVYEPGFAPPSSASNSTGVQRFALREAIYLTTGVPFSCAQSPAGSLRFMDHHQCNGLHLARFPPKRALCHALGSISVSNLDLRLMFPSGCSARLTWSTCEARRARTVMLALAGGYNLPPCTYRTFSAHN